jgi:hypothetical protein
MMQISLSGLLAELSWLNAADKTLVTEEYAKALFVKMHLLAGSEGNQELRDFLYFHSNEIRDAFTSSNGDDVVSN